LESGSPALPIDHEARQGTGDLQVLSPRPGGPAERLARLLDGVHPAAVFVAALIAGFAVVAALSIGLGLLVTEVLLSSGGLAADDLSVVETIVAERSPFLTDASDVGGIVGSYVLSAIAALVAIFFAFRREWGIAAFAAFVPFVESAIYRVTSMAVPRERPDVIRLEDLPADASYPSGHVAASVAVYGGLVLVLGSRIVDATARRFAWAAAILIPAFVALSRMYQGMHHPLDVTGGVLVGLAAIVIVAFACRSAAAASTRRSMY